jgi:hypothetical protein
LTACGRTACCSTSKHQRETGALVVAPAAFRVKAVLDSLFFKPTAEARARGLNDQQAHHDYHRHEYDDDLAVTRL